MGLLKDLAYLFAVSLFILGIKKLASPKTARFGNFLAMLGMVVAVVITLLDKQILDFSFIILGLVIGTVIGVVFAKKVKMTAMPQMVALFNSFGGGASALVAFAQFLRFPQSQDLFLFISIIVSLFIGIITFSGSLIAFAKLQGIIGGAPFMFKAQKLVNALILAIIVALTVQMVITTQSLTLMLVIIILSGILGLSSIIAIGGADMPVVIALLNSFSGLAAAATGFVLSSIVLIIAGSLVGASGIILTNIMCKAMNRSLFNVLFGAVGTGDGEVVPGGTKREVTGYSVDDAGMVLNSAQSVIVVPGYGLAVAQAQHVLHEVASFLQENGITVRYAIHPVAGRMPGHMNVLLAEANVPYDQLFEMEAINDDFQQTDVVLVIGANDVINPAARTKRESALYGMPILNVDHAKSIIIIKRSLNPGFTGEDNELFYDPKTMMVFGDAKKMLGELATYLKE